AQLVLTPASEGTAGAKRRAMAHVAERPGSCWYVDQHGNPDNAAAHARTTAEELWRDTEGRIDALVAGLGTTGTLCGCASVLKVRRPSFQAIGVEPAEAPMISGGRFAPHRMMGTSPGLVPDLLDRSLLDEVITLQTEDAFAGVRELARTEGLLVGITSGATCVAAREWARRPGAGGAVVVAVVADSGQRYLSVEGLFGGGPTSRP
ncbi:MAG TPA: pyridoxal-phosphate dependent enzyme, partial [Deltaproteobacteria bacterium]|nr:pyridoxal-phosphate dependent enzyme [Deltaproteobacteria bacterium]